MDNGPLWSIDDAGNYWLVFPNKHALGIEEIKDIFSKFGKIKNITTAGNEKGLRFVQYTTLKDVENAVFNLKDHPTVKLIPHRQKNKKNTNSDAGSKDNLSNNFNSQQTVTNNNNDRRNCHQRISSNDNNLKNSYETISSNSDTKSISEQMKKFKITSTDNVSNCSSNVYDSEVSFGEQSPGNQSSTKSLGTSSPPRLSSFTFNSLLQRVRKSPGSFSTVNSPSNNTTKSNLIEDDELPELITKPRSTPKHQQRKEFLNAHEVIVGNIHNDYGCAYILHLFEKFDPLAISYMQTVPKTNTRYCYVYFKTPQDSLKVETKFDKYELSGTKLIVLRSRRLIEEN